MVLDAANARIDTPFGAKALIGPPGNQVAVDFKPVDEPTAKPGDIPAYFPPLEDEALPTTQSAPERTSPGLKWQGDEEGAGGAGGNQSVASNAATSSAWALVYGATRECLGASSRIKDGATGHPALGDIDPVVPSWSKGKNGKNAWAIFPSPPTNCEQLLAMEEGLLCAANKLSELADAVAPVRWTEAGKRPPTGFPEGDWVIPPQKSEDQFIARDLALHLLANLATTDPRKFKVGGVAQTCADLFAKAVSDPTFATTNAQVLFGAPVGSAPAYFPPQQALSSDNAKGLASGRLLLEAQLLHAADQLAFDILEKNVETIEAAARSNRAKAPDAVEGGKAVWGVSTTNQPPYNSLAHSLRAVSGRLEMGAGSPDRACQGTAALNLLRDGYGADASADYEDRTVETLAQAQAMRLVESSGIVLPQAVTDSAPGEQLKDLLASQLVGMGAIQEGLPPEDEDYRTVGAGKTILDVVQATEESDLRFAFARSNQVFRRLSSSAGEAKDIETYRSVFAPDYTNPKIVGAGGLTIVGGTACGAAPSQKKAQLAGAEAASACEEYRGAEGILDPDLSFSTPFQSSIDLGQTLYRRLVVVRENAKGAGISGQGTVTDFAEIAAAQAKAWAGSSRMMVSGGTGAATVTIKLIGIEPEQFGVSDLAQLKDQLTLTAGPAWVANCALGLQAACPKGFEETYLAKPSSLVVDKAHFDTSQNRKYGTDGGVVTVTFETANLADSMKPDATGKSQESLYLVQTNATQGQRDLVGATRLLDGKAVAVGVLSPTKIRQRGNTDRDGIDASEPGDNCGNSTPDVCMNGVLKNGYIALQNDLTPGAEPNDASWKYYLNAARQAAEKTDQLGREAIEGLVRLDERREGAGERLAAICGDYGALADVKFSDGQVNAKAENKALQACLNEDKKDIVFLSTDPLKNLSPLKNQLPNEEYRQILLDALRCDAGEGSPDFQALGSNPLCEKAKSEKFGDITHGELALVDFPIDTAATSPLACDGMVQAAQSGMNEEALAQLLAASEASWTAPNRWLDLVRSLRLEEVTTDRWVVTLAGIPIMDTLNDGKNQLWPGCTSNCQGSALVMSRIFEPKTSGETASSFWAVQGALWTMASIAGEVPGKMFRVYLPAADLKDPSDWPSEQIGGVLGPSAVPVFAAYHGGKGQNGGHFVKQQTTSGTFYQLETNNPADQDALGLLIDFTHNPWGEDAPKWLKIIESTKSDYKAAIAFNKERRIPAEKFEFATVGGLKKWLVNNLSPNACSSTDENTVPILNVKRSLLGPICNIGSYPRFHGDMSSLQSGFASTRANLLTGCKSANDTFPKDETPVLTLPQSVSDQPFFNLAYRIDFPFQGNEDCGGKVDLKEQNNIFENNKNPDPLFTSGFLADRCRFQGFDSTSGGLYIHQKCFDFDYSTAPSPQISQADGEIAYRFNPDFLAPSVCEPSERLPAFLNTEAKGCSPSRDLLRAFALQCVLSSSSFGVPVTAPPPEITSLEAMPLLYAWVDRQERSLQQQISLLHIEHAPSRVLADFQGGFIGSGSVAGEYGGTLLQLQQALQEIAQGWVAISKNLQLLTNQIRLATLRLNANNIQEAKEAQNFALQSLQITSRITQSLIRTATAALSAALTIGPSKGAAIAGAVGAGAESAAVLYYAKQEEDILKELKNLGQLQSQNNVLQIIAELNTSVGTLYADINQALSMTRSATANARLTSQRLSELSEQAKYEAAKANAFGLFSGELFANADYASLGDKTVDLPLNTVLRRQAQIASIRHQISLKEARRLACIARLSIEQRLGVRLSEIKTAVGPYPPSKWADDVGLLGGVDYSVLRTSIAQATDPNSGQPLSDGAKDFFNTGVDVLADLSASKQFVGDYIDRLEDFTTFYNVQFPSQVGSDSVILSLANDILPDSGICEKAPPNLLFFSGDLSPQPSTSDKRTVGWNYGPCSSSRCLQAVPGTSYNPTLPGPVLGGDEQQATILLSLPLDPPVTPALGEDPLAASVWQSVKLNAGSYVVSWWAQSRGEKGSPNPTAASAYALRLFRKVEDGSLQVVASQQAQAHLPSASSPWGARRTLPVFVEEAGDYVLAFQPISSAEVPLPNVAIAAVQLEATNALSLNPTAYIQTGSSREYTTGMGCSLKPEDVRNAFEHVCPQGLLQTQCSYVLKKPFSLSLIPDLIFSKKKAVNEKFPTGNINFRHGTVALNLVGTAVHACDTSAPSSCFGSLYEQFSLSHLANPVPVANAMGKPPSLFYFGSQPLRDAKALAAERFLTLPLSSADQTLLSQPGFEHTEFRGRPLDGAYSLSIQDSPSLQWNRLEDIQIVLRYTYWSPTNVNAGNSGNP